MPGYSFPQIFVPSFDPNEWYLKNDLHRGGLNPGLFGHESSALTTRPRLLAFGFPDIWVFKYYVPTTFFLEKKLIQPLVTEIENTRKADKFIFLKSLVGVLHSLDHSRSRSIFLDTSRLLFKKCQYFLNKLWKIGDSEIRRLPPLHLWQDPNSEIATSELATPEPQRGITQRHFYQYFVKS
jgi:hypothetical protein